MARFDDEFIQYSKEKEKSEKKTTAFSLAVQITLYILLIFFAIFFIWYTAFISTHKYYIVSGASMKNTLNSSLALDDQKGTEDAVYVNTIAKIKVFDVVVAKRKTYNTVNKKWETKDVVKRVMGMEGDYVSVALHKDDDGQERLYFYRIAKGTDLTNFDDESARLDERVNTNGYTIYKDGQHDEWTERKDLTTFLDEGGTSSDGYNDVSYELDFFETFLEGHLAEIASGSDDFFVSDAGLVYVKIPKGMFFCMGDNRGHSSDSRNNGFYEMSQVVGKVEIVVYNYSFTKRLAKVVDYYFSEVAKFFAR